MRVESFSQSTDLFRQIVMSMSGAYKGLRLYPAEHPSVLRQVHTLLERLNTALHLKDNLKMGLLQGTLFLGEHLFVEEFPSATEIGRLLQHLEIEALEFLPGLSQEEIFTFLEILRQEEVKGEGLEGFLAEKGVRHIRLAGGEDDEDQEDQEPRKIYGRALTVVNEIFQDVRLGRIPSSRKAKKVVKDMARMTIADPHALYALSMLKNYDNYTFTHSVNVSVIALAIGRACGQTEEQLRLLGLGGLLHDIGKLKIDLAIINKPGRLTEREFADIKRHPSLGAEILDHMDGIPPESRDIVLGHHLGFNRNGYPSQVPLRGSLAMVDMATIADTYDAITTLRSYQRPATPREALSHMRKTAGKTLHPQYLQAFIASLGPYPVGSLIRLVNNEIGLVAKVGIDNPNEIQLKVLIDREGRRLMEPRLRHLSSREIRQIVAEVDPFLKGINPVDYL
ncbi:MAG: HD domain-containing protein [Syntrophotaleaceae bacterium]